MSRNKIKRRIFTVKVLSTRLRNSPFESNRSPALSPSSLNTVKEVPSDTHTGPRHRNPIGCIGNGILDEARSWSLYQYATKLALSCKVVLPSQRIQGTKILSKMRKITTDKSCE